MLSLTLIAPSAFAAEVLLYAPQDENQDPAATYSATVRPGEKFTLAAGVFERDPRDNGLVQQSHAASDFSWQPSCNTSSAACPTVSAGPGVTVTINLPICLPIGTTIFNVTQGGLKAAQLTLTNTEEPSICAESDYDSSFDEPYDPQTGLTSSGRRARSGSIGGRTGGSGGYGGGGSSSGRSAKNRRSGGDSPFASFWGGGGSGGSSNGVVDPYRPAAEVIQCNRITLGGKIVCQNVDDIKRRAQYQARNKYLERQKLAQQKLARQKALQAKQKAKPRAKKVVKAKAKDMRLVSR